MKKIFKISFGIIMLLMVTTSFVFASSITYTNEIGGIKTTPVSITSEGGNTTVSVSAIKPEGDAEDVTFIMTVYNKVTKKLENAKMLPLSVGDELVTFTFENIPGITEDHEINTSLVSLTNKFMPMGIPMTIPAKADAVNLRDLKIDGVSVIDKFDDENKLTYKLTKKLRPDGTGVTHTYDDINSMLMPYTVDAGSVVTSQHGDVFPGEQTLTVTDTDGNTKDYVINYVYPLHAVTGAMEDADFETKSQGKYDVIYGTINPIASKALAGDGYLYKNLHAFNVNGTEIEEKSGSVPFANYIGSNSKSYWMVTEINDPEAEGADYLGINTNKSKTFGENTRVDGSADGALMNTLEDGTEWFKFNLTHTARVTIYATVDCIDAYEADGWTGESSAGAPYIVIDRADQVTAGTTATRAEYTYKVYKDFPVGEVVINYHTVLNDNARAPFITVRH